MTFGIRAHDFGKKQPQLLAEQIATAGFNAVQLALPKAIEGISSYADINQALLTCVRTSFELHNLEISVLGCYIEPALPDRDARLAEVQKFTTGLTHAKQLDAKFVGTETTYFSPEPDVQSQREAAYQNLKDSVLRMMEEAERLSVNVVIEPVADHTLHSAELTKRLLDEVNSSRLQLIFDPVNLILANTAQNQTTIYHSFFEAVGQEIAIVHMKDIVFEQEQKIWRNIGSGIVDYAFIFQWLKTMHKQLPLLREHVRHDSSHLDLLAMRHLANAEKW